MTAANVALDGTSCARQVIARRGNRQRKPVPNASGRGIVTGPRQLHNRYITVTLSSHYRYITVTLCAGSRLARARRISASNCRYIAVILPYIDVTLRTSHLRLELPLRYRYITVTLPLHYARRISASNCIPTPIVASIGSLAHAAPLSSP